MTISYIVSKVGGLLLHPSTLILLALGLSIICLMHDRWRRWGLRLAITSFVALGAAGFLPIGNWLIMPLENRFANVPLPKAGEDVKGVIILGGFEDGWVTAGRPGLALNEAAERLTEGVRIAMRWPNAKVVFTGGVGGILARGLDAAKPIGMYLANAGIEPGRIILEKHARNTYQNATLTKELLKPAPGEVWVLVTSAYHMPRSIGVYRKAGFNITAAPVDFRTRDHRDVYRLFERVSAGLERTDLAVREWIGLLAYWLMGRTSALLPAPQNER